MNKEEMSTLVFKEGKDEHVRGFGMDGLADDWQMMGLMSDEEKAQLIKELDYAIRQKLSTEDYNDLVKEVFDNYWENFEQKIDKETPEVWLSIEEEHTYDMIKSHIIKKGGWPNGLNWRTDKE